MANNGIVMSLITGLERQISYKNYQQQFHDWSGILQNPNTLRLIHPANQSDSGEVIRAAALLLVPSHRNKGVLNVDPGGDFIFERIWVQPALFALSFITEDMEYELKIWNAYRSKYVQVTDVQVTDIDGTLLVYPALPDTINIFGDTVYTLRVYGEGPPLQNTLYKLTIDGSDFEIPVTGIRIIPWDLDPNWDAELKLTYSFVTTIWSNDKFTEQRRAISEESWLGISGSYDTSGDRARKIWNLIGYSKDKVMGVPIYNEKMIVASAGQGDLAVTISGSFANLYNLNNRALYIMIVDHDAGLAEIKAIESLTGSDQINLYQPISNNFNVNNTYVYPCVFAVIGAFSGNNITDDLDEVKIDFKEFKSG